MNRPPSRLRFQDLPTGTSLARRRWAERLRELVAARGRTLAEFGASVRPPLDARRVSEFTSARLLPDEHQLVALACACGASADLDELRALVAAVRADDHRRLARVELDEIFVVGEFHRWYDVGVHRPITTLTDGSDLSERVNRGELPAYVLRDQDTGPLGLRTILARTSSGAGPPELVLLSGESAAGKTRAAVEALRAVLGEWRFIVPRGVSHVVELRERSVDLRYVVVWFDEVQDILSDPRGIEEIDRLLDRSAGPTVLMATLRSDAEQILPDQATRLLNRRAHRVQLLRRPTQEAFLRELDRARSLEDPWIRDALAHVGAIDEQENGYGIAEWLAAGPQIEAAFNQAAGSDDRVRRTVAAITQAAIDCYRAGYTQPLPESLLRQAHRWYLPAHVASTDRQFDSALAQARQPVSGASALMLYVEGRGDLAFDYLLNGPLSRDPIKQSLWELLCDNITPLTERTVFYAALRFGEVELARTIARRADAAEYYYEVGDRERVERLRLFGDQYAIYTMAPWELPPEGAGAAVLPEKDRPRRSKSLPADVENRSKSQAEGDSGKNLFDANGVFNIEELERMAGEGDSFARAVLPVELMRQGDVQSLSRHADTGNREANKFLIAALENAGDWDAIIVRADCGDLLAGQAIGHRLAMDADIAGLTSRADVGDEGCAEWLAWVFALRGQRPQLERRADSGDVAAQRRLARVMISEDDRTKLTERADGGDPAAAQYLAHLLYMQSDFSALRERAERGDADSAIRYGSAVFQKSEIPELVDLAGRVEVAIAMTQQMTNGRFDDEAISWVFPEVAAFLRNTRKEVVDGLFSLVLADGLDLRLDQDNE